MQYNSAKKIFSAMTVAGMVFSASPVAFASGVRIVNNNSADVSTVVSVSAVSGSNTSRAGHGGASGDVTSSGDLATDNANSNTSGMGGGEAEMVEILRRERLLAQQQLKTISIPPRQISRMVTSVMRSHSIRPPR